MSCGVFAAGKAELGERDTPQGDLSLLKGIAILS